MKITKRQLIQLIREDYSLADFIEGEGVDRYDLYAGPDGEAAAAALDDLMEEISNFMNAAREKMDAIIKKHENDDSGMADYEAQDAVKRQFGRAVLGKFKR